MLSAAEVETVLHFGAVAGSMKVAAEANNRSKMTSLMIAAGRLRRLIKYLLFDDLEDDSAVASLVASVPVTTVPSVQHSGSWRPPGPSLSGPGQFRSVTASPEPDKFSESSTRRGEGRCWHI